MTSRFPLVDLQDWDKRGYRDTRLDDLSPEAAVDVLRGWGVEGEDESLRGAAAQVGYHALSVAVVGSYLHSFANGRVEEVASFDLDAVTGEDPKAAKLGRVLASYAERLPVEERELLTRLSVFPRGVTLELLATLVDAGGEVAGLLVNAKPRLVMLLMSLKARGLVFEYRSDASVTWTAHPFLRERFRELLGIPSEKMFDVVAQSLKTGLDKRPETKPSDPSMLDRYEVLIEATRLAGHAQEAFDLFYDGIGGISHLSWVLGEYQRGHRILAGFSPTGRPEDLGLTMVLSERSILATSLALFEFQLGRLRDAWGILQIKDKWDRSLPERDPVGIQALSHVAFAMGRLVEARAHANTALTEAGKDKKEKPGSLAYRGIALHALGEISSARSDFAQATELEGEPLYSLRGWHHARSHLDLGDLDAAHDLCNHAIEVARTDNVNFDFPRFHALLARIELAKSLVS